MKPTATNLIRWAGLSAVAAGSLFIGIQAIHPLDVLSSVSTPQWSMVHYISTAMCLFGIFGITGLYARQVEESGWLGLIGYFLLTTFYAITLAFQFIEALISPVLAVEAPQVVESFLGLVMNHPGEVDLGALSLIYMLNGVAGYMLGGLLFGIATFRAGVLPRWAGALLALGVVLPIVASGFIPHPYDRIFAVPVGAAVAWMGYALWAERRGKSAQSAAASSLHLQQSTVK